MTGNTRKILENGLEFMVWIDAQVRLEKDRLGCAGGGIGGKGEFAGDSAFDVGGWYYVFLGATVSHDRNRPCVKEVKQAVVDRTHANPQFMDSISEKVGLRAPQFMSQHGKSREGGPSFDKSFNIGSS